MTPLDSLAPRFSATFLIWLRSACLLVAFSTVCWAILYQLAIKNVPTDMSMCQSDLGNPSVEDPYFQVMHLLIAK